MENILIINNKFFFTNNITKTLLPIIQQKYPQITHSNLLFYLSGHSNSKLINNFFNKNFITILEINNQHKLIQSQYGTTQHSKTQIKNILNKYPQIKNYKLLGIQKIK